MRTTRSRTVAVLAALVLSLSACGGDADTAGTTSGHNDADVEFATEMIPHHAQALYMVDMADGRDLDPEVRELMDAIEQAQGPEIEQMAGWLEDWDEEVPPTDSPMGDMGEMDHGDHGGGAGMMSSEDLDALGSARDEMFQQMWLEMMIEHHEGAIEMAEVEQADGEFPEAIELAGDIVESQTAEIETMEELLEGAAS